MIREDASESWNKRILNCFWCARHVDLSPHFRSGTIRGWSNDKAAIVLGDGVNHIDYAMKLFEWQVRRGKLALFEHPKGSRAWGEESVQRCAQLPGVEYVDADQCAFGLRVRQNEDLNKKPTRFMTNGAKLREALGRTCSQDHPHQPLLRGRAKKAEEYPKALCQAIVKGAEADCKSQLVLLSMKEHWAMEEVDEGIDPEELIDGVQEREQAMDQAQEGEFQPASEEAQEREDEPGD